MTHWCHFKSARRLCAVLAASLITFAAVPAAAQAVSLLSSDATVQPSASSPVRINQAFGSSNWSASANGAGTIWAGNGIQIPGVSPNRWFCYIDLNGNRSWGLRTRTVGWNNAANCPTNGLGSVSTSGLVAVIVEDGPPPSVVVQFPLNSSYWTSNYGYARSGAQTAVTASQLAAANARTAERVLLVHTGASGGTLCMTGSESGCSTALTWIPNATASTAVSTMNVTMTGFNAGWSGGWSGTSAGQFYLFASAVPSGLTVDVSSGATTATGGTHAVTGLTANTRYVMTVCSRLGTGGAGELCYDASADTGIQGVEVTTRAVPPPAVSIISTPANGTHYVAGEVIVTRISGLPSPGVVLTSGGGFPTSRMALQIGGATRQATPRVMLPSQLQPHPTRVDFTYTVTTSDFDADGISIPINSISGPAWTHETGGAAIDRDHAALPAQSAHQVVGHTASISATVPAALTEGNLNGATATVTLAGVTFGSGVTTASFELVTTMTGVSISSVSSVSSGDASATLTLSSTADISATGTLAVTVLGAAHSGSTDLTTAAVTVAPGLAVGSGVSTSALSVPVDEGGTGSWDVVLNSNPGAGCTGGVTIGVTSGDAAVTVSPAALTFTSSNWNTAQMVTATGVRDNTLDDETVTVGHAVTTGCAGTDYTTALAIADVTVSVDDNTSLITVDSPSVVEGGDVDFRTMVFTVTLSPAASVQATVTYAVASGGTATLNDDFFLIPNTATLTFLPGETSKTITPSVAGDTAQESDEGVQLFMSNPTPSRVVIAPGSTYPIGNIIDDDTPTLRIDSPRVLEGNTGTTEMEFTVTLLPAAAAEVTVDWSDAGEGTATSGSDYQELDGGTLTFAAGETSKTIAVAVRGDATVEPDETVHVRIQIDPAVILSGTVRTRDADGAIAAESVGVGTIANDDRGTGGPVVAQRPGAVILAAGDEAEIDLSTVFADPNGSALTYSAVSNNPDVVLATVQGSVLRLLAEGRSGTTEVSVTATNRRGQAASATIDVDVIGTESACSTAPAEAPEGGTATAVVELASAVAGSTTVRWHVARDTDPATADADVEDHGGVSGEVQVRAGERCAEIEIDILDDEDAEPAREWFHVVLRSSGGAQLARATIPVAVMEGVCDRTPVVRNALLAATDAASCEAPASADLRRVSVLTLAEAGLGALAAEDFGDLTGLRTLDLAGNGLTALPALPALVRLERLLLPDNALEAVPLAALPAPERLRELILSDNALSELPANAFVAAPALRSLRLDGNRLETLPAGLFAGSSSLRLLRLEGNPGAPFTVRVELERVDAQLWASSPAMLRAVVPLGAPFEFAVGLAAEGATFANGGATSETTVAGGETAGMPFAVDSADGFARVALTVPGLPDRQCLSGPCWRGFALEAGAPLALFARRVLGDEPVPLFGEDLRVSLSSLAEAAELVGDLEWSVRSSDPSLAGVHIASGHLLVEPTLGEEGDLRVEATATDANGQTTTVYFDVRVEFHWPTRSWRETITGEQR